MVTAQDEQSLEHSFAGACVLSRNNQMPGKSSADGNVSRFFIAYFAEHEHLRILAKEMAGSGGEIQTAVLVDFSLHYARNDLFSGILDSDNVLSPTFGKMLKARINCRCLTTAGGTGEEHQTGGTPEEPLQF